VFPFDPAKSVSGALAHGRGYAPSLHGVKVYLSTDDLAAVLARVEPAGGMVAVPKTQISPQMGFMGAFIDTEGNWVGVHSRM
jgi:hypothetical protein